MWLLFVYDIYIKCCTLHPLCLINDFMYVIFANDQLILFDLLLMFYKYVHEMVYTSIV